MPPRHEMSLSCPQGERGAGGGGEKGGIKERGKQFAAAWWESCSAFLRGGHFRPLNRSFRLCSCCRVPCENSSLEGQQHLHGGERKREERGGGWGEGGVEQWTLTTSHLHGQMCQVQSRSLPVAAVFALMPVAPCIDCRARPLCTCMRCDAVGERE